MKLYFNSAIIKIYNIKLIKKYFYKQLLIKANKRPNKTLVLNYKI